MNEYSKKILKVPTVTFVREQDQGKQPCWMCGTWALTSAA